MFTFADGHLERLREDVSGERIPYYLNATAESRKFYKRLEFSTLGKVEVDLGRFIETMPVYLNYQMTKL